MTTFTREPPRRNMLVHHTFNNIEGDRVVDESPQEIDGKVVGDVSFGYSGVVGSSARLVDRDSDVEITSLSSQMPLDEVFVSSWGRSEKPVSSTVVNAFATITIDGTQHTLTHSSNEETEEWQFAALRYDGQTAELHYGTHDGVETELVASVDDVGSVDSFELTFYTSGFGYIDDVRVYGDGLTREDVDGVFDIGAKNNLANAVGQSWENNGIPYRGNNKRLGGALAENKHQTLRTLDFLREARHIEDAAGKQLDKLGAIANISRKENEGDDKYRARIQATLAAARSSGTFEDLLDAVVAILDTEPTRVTLEQAWVNDPTGGIATARIYVRTADIEDARLTVSELTNIMKDAVIAGHDIEIVERGADPFTVINDSMVNDPDRGLTSDSIATGGGLVSDV